MQQWCLGGMMRTKSSFPAYNTGRASCSPLFRIDHASWRYLVNAPNRASIGVSAKAMLSDRRLDPGSPINQESQPILTRHSCAIATADSLMNVELDAILFSYVIFG